MSIYFKSCYIDDFAEEKYIWVDIYETGISKEIKEKAKWIDEECYNGNCFGVCIEYDCQNDSLSIYQDEPDCSLFYVDNQGVRHWFEYELSEIEKYFFFVRCLEEIAKQQ